MIETGCFGEAKRLGGRRPVDVGQQIHRQLQLGAGAESDRRGAGSCRMPREPAEPVSIRRPLLRRSAGLARLSRRLRVPPVTQASMTSTPRSRRGCSPCFSIVSLVAPCCGWRSPSPRTTYAARAPSLSEEHGFHVRVRGNAHQKARRHARRPRGNSWPPRPRRLRYQLLHGCGVEIEHASHRSPSAARLLAIALPMSPRPM